MEKVFQVEELEQADALVWCSACRQLLPSTRFYPSSSSRSGYQSQCRACRLVDPKRRDHRLKSRHGISEEDYLILLEKQEGTCAICTRRPEDELHGRLCVDHNHLTGEVRGLLCRACNIALGKMEDDPERLLAAAGYLMARRMM